MRILSVNGNPLLNIIHNDAVNVLRGAGKEIEMLVSSGYDPEEVEKLREEGKLPDKIVEILSNSEEAAAAAAAASEHPKDIVEIEKYPPMEDTKASVERVMEVVKAAEQLATPSSPKDTRARHSSSSSAPRSPRSPGFDVKKTTIVMSGHSLTSPGLGGTKKFSDGEKYKSDDEILHEEDGSDTDKSKSSSPLPPTYANLQDIQSKNNLDSEFIDRNSKSNGGIGIEVRNPLFNNIISAYHRPPLPPNPPNLTNRHKVIPSQLNLKEKKESSSSPTTPPPIPTPRTSISGTGRNSPTSEEVRWV